MMEQCQELQTRNMKTTINCLTKAANKNSYTITKLTKTPISNTKNIYEILVRENNQNTYIDIKIAIAGNVDAGKSTLPISSYNRKNKIMDVDLPDCLYLTFHMKL